MINEQEADLISELLDKSFEKFLCNVGILGDDEINQKLTSENITITDANFPKFEWILGRDTHLDTYTLNEFIRGFSLHISYSYKDNIFFSQDYEIIKDIKTGEIKYKKIHTEAILLGLDGDVIGSQTLFFMPQLLMDEVIQK